MDFLLFAQAGDTFADGVALLALLKQYGPLVLVMAFFFGKAGSARAAWASGSSGWKTNSATC